MKSILLFKRYKTEAVCMVLVALTLITAANCGGSKEKKKKETKTLQLVLKDVKIDPDSPTSIDYIRAVPVLENSKMRHVSFSYTWFVNGDRINDAHDSLLEKKYYKKGDSIYCKIKATRGPLKSEEVESKAVEVGNAPPSIVLQPVENFNIPGQFTYQINATDPDNDKLTYHLLHPTDWSIYVDKDTGAVTWDVPDLPFGENQESPPPTEDQEKQGIPSAKKTVETKTPKFLPETITLIFEVRDSNNASASQSITLRLSKDGGSELDK